MTHWPSQMLQVLLLFHNFLQNSLHKSLQFTFSFFYKFTKIKIKSFYWPKSLRNYGKITLGTLDAWSMSCSSHQPINLLQQGLAIHGLKLHKPRRCTFFYWVQKILWWTNIHSVSYYYAVLPFYDVKCLCFRGSELGREGSHSH